MAELSDQEMLRYNRQIILRGFDFDGQEALKDSRVLIVGLGGLGCAASQYLASAGVGNLTLLDFDTVSLSNLQRQTLHSDATVGQPKVESARTALARINPHVRLVPLNALLDEAALAAQIADHDLVLDCTDNVAIRNQLNAGCFRHQTPVVSGAAIRMEGQISVFTYQQGEPCYRCLSRLFGENAKGTKEANADLTNQELLDISQEDTEAGSEEIESNDSETEGTPGEAVLTNGSAQTTVAQAKVTREQVRAQNKETLQSIIDNTELSEEEKSDAVAQMVELTKQSETEMEIETLMATKGFSEAVVSLGEDSADVVVNAEELTDANRAQIEDIVTRKSDVKPEKIVITPIHE